MQGPSAAPPSDPRVAIDKTIQRCPTPKDLSNMAKGFQAGSHWFEPSTAHSRITCKRMPAGADAKKSRMQCSPAMFPPSR